MRKKTTFGIVIPLLCLTFLIGACSSTTTGTQHSTVGQTVAQSQSPSPHPMHTARQLLQMSSQAMQNLNSVHFKLQATIHYATSSSKGSTNVLQPLTTLAGTHDTEIDGSGDHANPQLSSLQLDEKVLAAQSGAPFKLSKITQDTTLYLRAYTDTWYTTTAKTFPPAENSAIYTDSGLQQLQALIQTALQKGTLSDKGPISFSGKSLRHIEATFSAKDQQTLTTIDVENALFTANNDAQNYQKPRIDFFIDAGNGYVYQAQSTLQYEAYASHIPVTQALLFQCSDFNQPVQIALPTHTTPLTSIDQLLSY